MNFAPLKHLVDPRRKITYGIVQAGPDTPGGVPYIRPTDMTPTAGVPDPGLLLCTTPEIAATYKRSQVLPGDVILSIGPSYGKVMIVPTELSGANLTQGTARLAPAPRVSGRFLYWALQSKTALDYWDMAVAGATFRALNLGPLAETPIPAGPPEERVRIADFLDDQVPRLDRAILLGQRQFELLEQAALSEMTLALVGRDNAETVPIKWLGAQVTTGPFGTVLAANEYVDGGIPIINPSHIIGGQLRPNAHETVPTEVAARLERHKLREGNLVVSRKGDIGRSALVGAKANGWICGSDSIAIDLTNARIRPRYLQALLRLPATRDQLLERSVGATMPSLNEDNLLGLRIPNLNELEQVTREQSAFALDEQTQRARGLIAQRERGLQERKLALITAAVTGQFDVTTARAVA